MFAISYMYFAVVEPQLNRKCERIASLQSYRFMCLCTVSYSVNN